MKQKKSVKTVAPTKPANNNLRWIVCTILTLLFAGIMLYNLGNAPLENWDEGFYGENIKQIVATGNWSVLYFNEFPFTEKPPLYMWIGSLISYVIGFSELSIRLPSALAAIGCVGLVLWYMTRKFGLFPAVVSYFVLAFNTLFIWRGREGNLDTLAMFFFLCIFILINSRHKYRYLLLGILFALLYLTKMALVLLPIGIFVLYELLYRRQEWKKNLKNYAVLAGAAILPVAVWLAAATNQLGQAAIVSYIFESDAGAYKVSLSNVSLDYVLFAYYSFHKALIPLLVVGLLFVLRNIKNGWNLTLLLFSSLLLLQLMFFERKNNWYLLPLFPFWAIAAGYGMGELSKFAGRFFERFRQEGAKKAEGNSSQRFVFFFQAVIIVAITAVCLHIFTVQIIPMFTKFGTTREMQTAKQVERLTAETDVVARLDHRFPTAIFYTNRRVLSSPWDYTGDGGFKGRDQFISRVNLANALTSQKARAVFGVKQNVLDFIKDYSLEPKQIIETNDEEIVAFF